jgi:glucose/arabinose dehydrogenase
MIVVMIALISLLAAGALLLASAGPATPPAALPEEGSGVAIVLAPFADGLDDPVLAVGADDGTDRLFVVEQAGTIRILDASGSVRPEPFLDIRERVRAGGERGLLGLAFHPAFASNGRLFVHYTSAPDGATVVSEILSDGERADPVSERVLLQVEQPFANHNGGMIAFDVDGHLLIGLGDGGGGGDPLGAGQDTATLLGALLRIDVDEGDPYGIPADNGLVDDPAARPEIHAYGLRNPWRFSVDRETGDVWIGDVGQSAWEEIDLLPAGESGLDFGWNEMEGPVCFQPDCDPSAHEPPVAAYSHDHGCSVIGGYVYRGAREAALDGVYLFGDYCSGTIWSADAAGLAEGTAEALVAGSVDGPLVSFGEDDASELYAVSGDGRILRIEAGAAPEHA